MAQFLNDVVSAKIEPSGRIPMTPSERSIIAARELATNFDEFESLIVNSQASSRFDLERALKQVAVSHGQPLAELLREITVLQDVARRKLQVDATGHVKNYTDPQTSVVGDSISEATSHTAGAGRGESTKRVFWVTKRSLEQATCWQVSTVKAGWFLGERVSDFCCGLGGDAMSLLSRGDVAAVERDPLVATMARANLASEKSAFGFEVVCDDVSTEMIPEQGWLHIDPDRRVERRTARDPELFSPSWLHVSAMLGKAEGAVVKLAPATAIPAGEISTDRLHRCWIEFGGSVREQSVLWGAICEHAGLPMGRRSAMLIRRDGSVSTFGQETTQGKNLRTVSELTEIQDSHLIDPRAAIRAAGLTEDLAERYGAKYLSGPAGFLLAGDLEATCFPELSEFATLGRVFWVGACDDRKLRKELRGRNVYPEVIKVRGTDHDPAALFKRYRSCGERPVKLWIGRFGKRVFAAMTECDPIHSSANVIT